MFSCKLGRHDERVSTGETGARCLVAIQGEGMVTKLRREGGKSENFRDRFNFTCDFFAILPCLRSVLLR